MWLAPEVWEGGPWAGLALEAWPVAAIGQVPWAPAVWGAPALSTVAAEVRMTVSQVGCSLSPIPTSDCGPHLRTFFNSLHVRPGSLCHIGKPVSLQGPQ